MSAEIDKAKEHLVALKAFIASPAHVGYLAARDEEISNIEKRILNTPPIDQRNIADLLMAHGELDSQTEMKQTFESARVQLEARIDEMVEQENQNASNTKV
jgi:uncharacterized protein YneF (UPF0154 family)